MRLLVLSTNVQMVGLKYCNATMRCDEVVYGDSSDANAPPVELRCTLGERATAADASAEGGENGRGQGEGSKKLKPPKGTISWVPGEGGVRTEVRLYNHLFTVDSPDDRWEEQVSTRLMSRSLVSWDVVTHPTHAAG